MSKEQYVSFNEFVPIHGFSDYLIDTNGNVYSTKSKRFLKCTNRKGYVKVTLCTNGVTKDFSLHRLVASTFIPNPNNLPQVNHIDGNKLNNNVSNLEWCTSSQNIKHAYDNGIGRKHWGPHTQETKNKISKSKKGQHLSGETRQKIKEKLIGRFVSDETKKKHSISAPKRQIIDTSTGIRYNSIKEASDSLGIGYKTLYTRLRYGKERRFVYV